MANSSPTYGALQSESLSTQTLEAMWFKGIHKVDSAHGYQHADEILKQSNLNWEVQTKIRIETNYVSLDNLKILVENSIGKQNVYSILIHNPEFLYFSNASNILEALKAVAVSHGINKIGISVYRPEDLEQVKDWELIEIVQFPHNPLDSNCLDWFGSNSPKSNTTLQARSIFLQGLLVSNSEIRKEIPKVLFDEIREWHEWLLQNNVSPVEYCVDFAVKNDKLNQVVIGIESTSQGIEILEYINQAKGLDNYPRKIDPLLTDPRKWNH